MYAFLGLTVLTAAVSLGVYSVADAQVNQKEEITKEEFLDFQRQWFNYMDQRGMNPGEMMGENRMNEEDFMNFQEEAYDLMRKYEIDPTVMMKNCACQGMMS
ncbi:MAG: hypothetical protein A2427_02245 [Candidatus Nealsonbacteria bacterium RIFOXYC1_FULL_40_7]|nr:MAG: hypothetical protein A2427_02245 [Candidatus Nealsonbacteria bacterium RIFOXYC1_FULL_40_7]OGZ28966.1 MAG: hypothetical protein A2562_03165 [Candidatus Nealsonbacteria bacterium RIFOXYD1_FULL_39_11]